MTLTRMPQLAALALVAALASTAAMATDTALPRLQIDAARTAVVGLSSGAYMAGQLQMAYPEAFPNAAMIAGGPWDCADGSLKTALTTCMHGDPDSLVPALVARAGAWAAEGKLGNPAHLAKAHVYLLHGRQDTTVAATVAAANAGFYKALQAKLPALAAMRIVNDDHRAFAHNLPTLAQGEACDASQSPYLGRCGFDAAGAVFAQMFGAPSHPATEARGTLQEFDQNALRVAGADAYLAERGYLYVPPDCAAGKPCGLLVALHGCKQNVANVGTAFVRDAGFNRWGDVYNVAILYPQTRASFAPLNPQACWDWWGYSGDNYATRNGAQLRWVMNAAHTLGLPGR